MIKIFGCLLLTALTASAASVADRLGLEMYSLRVQLKQDGWKAALDQTKEMGFAAIEGGGFPYQGLTMDQFKAELSARGIRPISASFDYARLTKDLAGAVAEAKQVGAKYIMLGWIPHPEPAEFNEAQAKQAVTDFNVWGKAFKEAGITFMYHAHGYEFRPRADGTTLFDLIARETKPEYVSFEMDVFWVTHGGQDPVKLLAKYPDRWKAVHIKDIRKGAPTGIYTGHAPETDDVPVGTGQVDWPAVLKKAQAVGVEWYFIEDESATPTKTIPQSVAYVRSLGL